MYLPPQPRKSANRYPSKHEINPSHHGMFRCDRLPLTVENPELSFPSQLSTFELSNFDSSVSASSLAQSLNDVINTRIDEVTHVEAQPYSDFSDIFRDIMIKHNYKIEKPHRLPEFVIHPLTVDSFNFTGDHHRYLTYFYYDFARVISPLTPSPTCNPARDILLSYAKDSSYLMAAVLSCGALQAHRKSNDLKDEDAYCKYLSTCTRLLAAALADENQVKAQVEPMILTILLLTSYTAVSNIQNWRPHLRAAKELLAAYVPRTGLSGDSDSAYTIAFCRLWYTSIELVAQLTVPRGGTADSEVEIDSLNFNMPNLSYYLEKMHLNRKDGFNFLCGYASSLGESLQKLAKYTRRFRKFQQDRQADPNVTLDISLDEYHELMGELWSAQNFYIISKDGIVPKDHFMNPANDLNPPPDFEPLSSEAIDEIELKNGQIVCVSWYDISHQSFVWTAILLMLSMLGQLPKRHYMVQQAVHKMLKLMIFLHAKKTVTGFCIMMLQSSMYITGLNCILKEDRELVIKYFQSLSLMGNISAKINLQKLHYKWRRYDKNSEKNIEIEFDDFDEGELPTDIITY